MGYKKHNRYGGLFDYQERVEEFTQRTTALDKLNETVNWELFRPVLEKQMNDSDQIKGGRPLCDPVFMFKLIVLQKYYGVSEEETEFQILARFSFQCFLDLDVSSEVPDKNTVWRSCLKTRSGSPYGMGVPPMNPRAGQQKKRAPLAGSALCVWRVGGSPTDSVTRRVTLQT